MLPAGAGAPYVSARHSWKRRCPHRPTVHRHGAAVRTRLPEGPTARRRPARTPALHGVGAPYVSPRHSWSAGVLTGQRCVGTAAPSARDWFRDCRCGAGRRGRRRSRGPTLHTSARATPGAPVSSPATGSSARRRGRHETGSGTAAAAQAGEDAGAPWGRRSIRQRAPLLERRCPHRPTHHARLRRWPARTPALQVWWPVRKPALQDNRAMRRSTVPQITAFDD